jgi:hypothetical protein
MITSTTWKTGASRSLVASDQHNDPFDVFWKHAHATAHKSHYKAENRHKRKESERFHCFTYDALVKRDKPAWTCSGSISTPFDPYADARGALLASC